MTEIQGYSVTEINKMKAEIERLRAVVEAANRLQNEVHGSLRYLDRDVCGNTNYICLQTAAIVTRDAIAALDSQICEKDE